MPSDAAKIIVVDLDGTLLATDTLLEGVVRLLLVRPWLLLVLPLWLMKGRAILKAKVAERVYLRMDTMPVHQELLDWLKLQKSQGARLWLCSGTAQAWASAAAQYFGIFEGFDSSDTRRNLTGDAKAQVLVEKFGDRGFIYCGNEARDAEVWSRASGAAVVGRPALAALAATRCAVHFHIEPEASKLVDWVRLLRIHQWAKNILLFVPLLAAHRLTDASAWQAAFVAFAAFCFIASATYVLNDMADMPADRLHPRKKGRAIAAGHIGIPQALVAALVLAGLAFALSAWLPTRFAWALLLYLATTLAYSWGIKRLAILDTLTLAGLYTLRLVAGAVAVGVALSFWLLAFSGFLFFSLALVKRSAELRLWIARGQNSAEGRGYEAGDLPLVDSMGISAGLLSVLVLALYVNSGDTRVLYSQPYFLWGLCPLMTWWIARVWLLVHRGRMHDDPVVFALTDRASIVVTLIGAVLVWAGT